MDTGHTRHTTSRVLIPWDGAISLDLVLGVAREVGGHDATMLLLPVSSKAEPSKLMDVTRPEPSVVHSGVVYLDVPDSPDPMRGIEDMAATHEADLILMATRCHPSGALDASCLAAQLALDSPIPVLVVHVDDGDPATVAPSLFSRLLVPLDGSMRARQVLPFAAILAHRLDVPVQRLMVLDPRQALPPGYAYDPDATLEMVAALRRDAHRALTQAEQSLSRQGVAVHAELIYGPVVPSLQAAMRPGDMVVMTTRGAGSASDDRLGSVAARLVADAPTPMVIMRSSPPSDVMGRAYFE